MHENSLLLFQTYAKQYFSPGLSVLEVGPDAFPSSYRRLAEENLNGKQPPKWDTIDLTGDNRLTYHCSEYSFPVPDNSYDIVLSGQVIEHVAKVWLWIKELARVCKPGGHVIIINPVSWTYHNAPIDCWRIYPEGMRALFDEAGIEMIDSRWESLETPGYRRYIPGVSRADQGRRVWLYRLFGWIGLPVERSYDTISIGRKPG